VLACDTAVSDVPAQVARNLRSDRMTADCDANKNPTLIAWGFGSNPGLR